MNKVRLHNYPISVDIDTNKIVDVYIDEIVKGIVPRNTIRIVILEEPKKRYMYKFYRQNTHTYSFILTFHDELLTTNPKARKCLFINTWVKDYVSPQKRFSVSTVVGGKKDPKMEGYALRHDLWRHRKLIDIPREFYLSGDAPYCHTFVPWNDVDYDGELVLGDSKIPMFDSMFHVAIENTSIKNYFSEKLTDCFRSRTVPIYYGCRNVEEYFNPNGILRVGDVSEMVKTCNRLNPDVYQKMLPYIEDNYKRAEAWLDPQVQLTNAIKSVING